MLEQIEQVEESLALHLERTASPTKYIAGFRTPYGRELALERVRPVISIWTEHIPGAGKLLELPSRHYPSHAARNSNLNGKNAPRLRQGREADYWRLAGIESLKKLLKWYLTQ